MGGFAAGALFVVFRRRVDEIGSLGFVGGHLCDAGSSGVQFTVALQHGSETTL